MKKTVATAIIMALLLTVTSFLIPVGVFAQDQIASDEEHFPPEEGWIPITKPADWANIKAGGKYYLANDIVFESKQYMPSADESVDLVIDGNNRTVTLSQTQKALFSKTTRLTMKNIFIDGTLVYGDHAGMNSPIVQWDNLEKTVLINVISRVNYRVTNTAGDYVSISGVIPKAPEDSIFQKVMYTGSISVELGAKFLGAAGITYNAKSASLIDCINNGDITVKGAVTIAAPKRGYFAVGGICAITEGSTSFLRCVNNGDLTSDAYVMQHESKVLGNMTIGGIVGCSAGDSFTDCKNTGNISQKAVASECAVGFLGGIIGYSPKTLTIKSSTNSGNIFCDENGFSIGGMVGRASGTKINGCSSTGKITVNGNGCLVGGIQGYSYNGSADVVECTNAGEIILSSEAGDASVGGILGCAKVDNNTFGSVWIEKSTNSGNITADTDTRNLLAGGIVGKTHGVSSVYIQKCLNSGDITNGMEKGSAATGGVIGSLGNIDNSSMANKTVIIEIYSCINTGVLYGNDRVGGIVGGVIKLMVDDVDFSINKCSNRGELHGISGGGGILGYFNESSYNSTTKTYSAAGVTISLCENAASVIAEKIAGGIIGCLGDSEAEPKIELISCVSAAKVGMSTTKVSGAFVGQTPLKVSVTDCISMKNPLGEQTHAIGNGELIVNGCFYFLDKEDMSIDGAEAITLEELSAKRAELEVLAFDRESLQAELDSIAKLNKDEYKLSSWLDLMDEVEVAQELLKKEDTELYQSEISAKLSLLKELRADLLPIAAQTEKTDKPTEPASEDDGCGGALGGAAILASLIAIGAAFIKKNEE